MKLLVVVEIQLTALSALTQNLEVPLATLSRYFGQVTCEHCKKWTNVWSFLISTHSPVSRTGALCATSGYSWPGARKKLLVHPQSKPDPIFYFPLGLQHQPCSMYPNVETFLIVLHVRAEHCVQ